MIYDSIKNANLYFGIHRDIKDGLKYLAKLNPDIKLGEYRISKNIKAIVNEYWTVEYFEKGYEAHKKAIDIHYPIIGRKRIKWLFLENLEENIPYDKIKDVAFYNNSSSALNLDIGNGFFAILLPYDAHRPLHFVDKPKFIKKLYLKLMFFSLVCFLIISIKNK